MSSFLGVKDRPNLTGGDIKTAYEAQPDTNAFNDAEKAQVAANKAGIEQNTAAINRNFASPLEMIQNAGTYPQGTRLQAGGYEFQAVNAAGHLTANSTQNINHIATHGRFYALALNPSADGLTDDAAKLDSLNQSGALVDLGGKDFRYVGAWDAAAVFVNGRVIDDSRAYDYRAKTNETAVTGGQKRARINYATATSVRVDGLPDSIAMGGFYSFGQYLKGKGRLVETGLGAASHKIVSSADVAGLSAADGENWYAVFAVANDNEDTCRFVWVPYFRCYSIAGNVVTLGRGDENQNVTPATKAYSMANDAFNGADCLVITEGGNVSRRVTTITDSDSTTITLADASGVDQLDFLLPAPPGAESYHYLGTFLFEGTGDVRNIADSGYDVAGRMVNLSEIRASGVASNEKLRFGGMISPLATGVVGSMNQSVSTASTGTTGETLGHDSSSHDVWRCVFYKDGTGAFSGNDMARVPFSKEQALWHNSNGSVAANVVARTFLIYGWIE